MPHLICVVNTTGTPYFERQLLRDVVIWYGLSEGIRDSILKELSGGIQSYDFANDPRPYVAHVVEDFFRDYGTVHLPNGAAAKLALYFPQTEDLKALRPAIDEALLRVRQGADVCLVNTSDASLTKQADIDAFNRLNDPNAPHRVVHSRTGTLATSDSTTRPMTSTRTRRRATSTFRSRSWRSTRLTSRTSTSREASPILARLSTDLCSRADRIGRPRTGVIAHGRGRLVRAEKELDQSALALRAERRILFVRGHKVLLDADLAELYEVPTRRLNEQVRRNRNRFPADFMLELSQEEFAASRSQSATSKRGRGGHRYRPL